MDDDGGDVAVDAVARGVAIVAVARTAVIGIVYLLVVVVIVVSLRLVVCSIVCRDIVVGHIAIAPCMGPTTLASRSMFEPLVRRPCYRRCRAIAR